MIASGHQPSLACGELRLVNPARNDLRRLPTVARSAKVGEATRSQSFKHRFPMHSAESDRWSTVGAWIKGLFQSLSLAATLLS
jgi:hypothetical protein